MVVVIVAAVMIAVVTEAAVHKYHLHLVYTYMLCMHSIYVV